MSYFVWILRRSQGRPVPITRVEVEAVLATRPDLDARPTRGGELEIRIKALGERGPVLEWTDGEIAAQDPDDRTFQLMLDLAAPLRARVRGSEMETYRSVDDTYAHPDDAAELEADKFVSVAAAKRREWTMRLAPIVIASLAAAAYALYAFASRR